MNSLGLHVYKWMKKKFEKNSSQAKKEEDYPYVIELENGEVTNIKGFSNDQLTNKISTSLYRFQNLFLLTFLKNVTRFGNILFYFVFFFLVLLYNQHIKYPSLPLFK